MTQTPLAVGLIGAGGISHAHIPAWLELGASVTVFTIEGGDEVAARYGIRHVESLEELLAGCDLVDICTPTPTHRFLVEAALTAGKDVVCEKPIALTRADAEAIGALAAAVGHQVFPAHVVRYFPEYRLAQQAIAAGQIGQPAISRFTRIGAHPAWADWFGDNAQSGGIIMDQMIHDLDIARWICGEVVDVYAVQSRVAPATTDNGAGERGADVAPPCVTAQVVLTHESGALSYVTGVWGPPGTTFTTSFSLAGSEGVLVHDSRTDLSIRFDTGERLAAGGMRPDTSLSESPYLTELRDFAAAFAGGSAPRVSFEDGVRAVDIATAANESLRIGASVTLLCADQGVFL